jgi:lysophospholipase L1-like esterase
MHILGKISVAFSLIVLTAAIYLFYFGRNYIREFLIVPHYDRKFSAFINSPLDSGAIIFLGNSITEGGNWSELFPDKKILNRGINGDITSGVLARMDEIVRHQPSKVFVCIGTNDIAAGIKEETTLSNYDAIIEKLQKESPSTRIFVQSILPVGKWVIFGHDNDKINHLNPKIEQVCKRRGVSYLDINNIMKGEDGYLKKSYTNDNLHLMGEAYQAWGDFIRAYVEE